MIRNDANTYYHLSANGKKLCDGCIYKRPWQDMCVKFNTKIFRVGSKHGSFHHKPCYECLNTKKEKL